MRNVVTPAGLDGGFNAIFRSIEAIERNVYPIVQIFAEPQMGRRGLYPTLGTRNGSKNVRQMMNVISYSDGRKSLLEIADLCEVPIWELYSIIDTLTKHKIIELSQEKN